MSSVLIYVVSFILLFITPSVYAEETTRVMTLQQAQSLALMKNPGLAAFSLEIRAKEAQAVQAGFLPNPEIGFTIENFGGSRDLRGFQGTETTIQIGQMVEMGGKRLKRRYAATLERDLANWDYEAKRADVLSEVTKAFIEVLTAQERLGLTEELVSLSEQVFNTISARVTAGKVSPVEETKAGVALATVRIELERSKRELEAKRKRLAATCGSTFPVFEKVEGQLDLLKSIPPAEKLEALISQNPDIARWSSEMEQRNAVLKLEKSKSIPDPTFSLGFRRLNETDNNAFVLGISIPIPLFNRNQGGVIEAQKRIAKAEENRMRAKLQVLSALSEAYQLLASSYAEAATLKDKVLPGALSAFEAVREGYRQGKFGYLDVLDAQRTFFEAKSRYIESLSAYQKAAIDINRLIGEQFDVMRSATKEKL